jgi:hypothetical protein
MHSDHKKLKKFISRLDELIRILGRYHNSLPIRSRIDQFFYMHKSEELKVLHGKIQEVRERLAMLEHRYDSVYRDLFRDYVRDVRWLKRYLDSTFKDKVEEKKG